MKSKNRIAILIAVVIIALLIWIKPKNPNENSTQKEIVKHEAVLVSTFIVKPLSLDENIQTAGSVLANEEVDLRSDASGKITNLFFTEDSRVTKGQVLLKIDDSELQAQLLKDESAEKLAVITESRQKKLLTINGISQQDYDIALNALNSVKADIDLLNAQIVKTEVKAPFNGIVGLRNVSVGSYVSPAVSIATIQEIEPVKIDFSIPEKYMDAVHKGDSILFKIQGIPKTLYAIIYAIEPKVDMNTRTVHVRALAPNKDDKIFPGAYAEVHLILNHTNNALMVPTQAIVPVLKGQQVFLFKSGKAFAKDVNIGIRNDSEVQVTSGLQPGDSIITTGIMSIRDGASVKIDSKK
ncbi:MAG: efflux RND transporter periplasmic adaptor subunit [Bacteroidia bacterium]